MPELIEPVYKEFYKLSYKEAFSKVSGYLDKYQIKKIDKDAGQIIIEASYRYSLMLWSTWINPIVVQFKQRGTNITMIEIYGKPKLSPHHLLRIPYYRKIRIDISRFKEDFKRTFKEYEFLET